jgi:hypothetical protein
MTTFTVASNEFLGGGKEKAEYHAVVTWVLRPVGRTLLVLPQRRS